MKKMAIKSKVIIIIFVLVSIICMYIYIINRQNIEINYSNNHAPQTTYKGNLNTKTRLVKLKVYHSCSAIDCDGKEYNYNIVLNKVELEKLLIVYKKGDYNSFSSILESICKNNQIFLTKSDDFFEEYRRCDINSDEKITQREFGNCWVDDWLEENN